MAVISIAGPGRLYPAGRQATGEGPAAASPARRSRPPNVAVLPSSCIGHPPKSLCSSGLECLPCNLGCLPLPQTP